MSKGKITKREIQLELKGALIGIGAFIIYFPFRSWIMENFPIWIQFAIGIGIILFALKKW